MNWKYLILQLWIACVCMGVKAQSFTLKGTVSDENGSPIEFASVSCAKQGKMTMTSLKGEYSLMLNSADTVEVTFSMIGYVTKKRTLTRPSGRQTLHITLHSRDNEISEVTVTGQKIETGQTTELSTDHLKSLPSATGNAVEQLIQTQAGVSSHNELSSQYNVRGGSFDENCVYINDVEIYRPFLVRSGQQEGISVINPDMVDRIKFSTGGYEARYGDKMSSALSIYYRKPKKFEANVSASLLGCSAFVGMSGKKLSWSNAIRYKTTSSLLGSMDTKGEYSPSFVDYQTYLTFTPNKRWDISLLGNISDNHYNFTPSDRETKFGTMEDVKSFKVYFDGQEKDVFRTFFGALNITRHINDHSRLSLIFSAFHTREQERYDLQGQYWLTQTETSENLGVGTYFQHARNYLKANVQNLKLLYHAKTRKHEVEGAFAVKWEDVRERSVEYEMRDSSNYSVPHTGNDLQMVYSIRSRNSLKTNRLEAYVQDTYRFGDRGGNNLFTLTYGLRFARWGYTKETIVSPRVSLGMVPGFNQDMTFRLAAGVYYQAPFFKEIRDTMTVNGNLTASLNNKAKSQRSIHLIAGYDYRFKMNNRPFKFTAEAFYKHLSDLVPYSVNNVKVVYYGDRTASGHIAGLDLKLFGEFVPGSDSWLSLSLMDTSMKVDGKTLPLPTDQSLSVNMFFTDYFPGTKRWKMSLKLAYAAGLPFSAPHRELDSNVFHAPAYKRADIGLSYRLLDNNDRHDKKMPLRNVWLGVECLNLLGINNVNSYYWITDVVGQQYAVPNYLTGRMLNFRVSVDL